MMEEKKNVQEEVVSQEVTQELQEEIQEEVKEETKVTEVKKDEFVEETDPRLALEKPFYYPLPQSNLDNSLKNINEQRTTFYEEVIGSNRNKKIVLFSFLGVFFIFMIAILINHQMISKLLTPLFIVFFIFLVVTYFIVNSAKKKKLIAFDAYKQNYFLEVDSYTFYQVGFSNIEFSYNSKVNLEEISKLTCYEKIIHTVSRDVVRGNIFGVPFLSYDLLLKTGEDVNDTKSMSTIFSGKMIHLDLVNQKAGKMVIYLKGCGDAYPTELKGLEPCEIKDLKKEYQVFTSYEKPSTTLNKKAIEALNTINIDSCIEDVIIEINSNGIFFGLSYTSECMKIPFETPVEATFMTHYKNDVETIAIFISSLLSSKSYKNKALENK